MPYGLVTGVVAAFTAGNFGWGVWRRFVPHLHSKVVLAHVKSDFGFDFCVGQINDGRGPLRKESKPRSLEIGFIRSVAEERERRVSG